MKKYKGTLILGSLVTLLPMVVGLLLWDRLPDVMPIHWAVNGEADAAASPWFIVFLIPLILLALLWLCVWITFRDSKNKRQNPKAMKISLWIVPVTSLFSMGIIYTCAFRNSLSLFRIVPLFLGCVFLIIGNYMPKITRNSYLGIKTKWTLYNEENWNATHRFCGRLWFLLGLITLAGALLPEKLIPLVLLIPLLGIVLSSLLYPYLYYRKQIHSGMAPIPRKPLTKKRILRILGISLALLLLVILLVYLLFAGEICVRYDGTSFTIVADYMSDLTVDYDTVTSVEYVQDPDLGTRVSGFGSPRLLMGIFHNKEYGTFTLYAYTGCDSAVLLRSGDRLLLLNGSTPEATMEIYEQIKERVK